MFGGNKIILKLYYRIFITEYKIFYFLDSIFRDKLENFASFDLKN